jgi:hypothetical protein
MSNQSYVPTMETQNHDLLSQQELAQRWGRSVSAIGLSSALGLGPKYIKSAGALRYPVEEVQKYEQTHFMH